MRTQPRMRRYWRSESTSTSCTFRASRSRITLSERSASAWTRLGAFFVSDDELDLRPDRLHEAQVALEILGGRAGGGGADDDAALLDLERLGQLAQPLALAVGQPPAHARAGLAVGREHQEPAGDGELHRHPRPLRPHRVLDDLDEHLLAGLQELVDLAPAARAGRCLRRGRRRRSRAGSRSRAGRGRRTPPPSRAARCRSSPCRCCRPATPRRGARSAPRPCGPPRPRRREARYRSTEIRIVLVTFGYQCHVSTPTGSRRRIAVRISRSIVGVAPTRAATACVSSSGPGRARVGHGQLHLERSRLVGRARCRSGGRRRASTACSGAVRTTSHVSAAANAARAASQSTSSSTSTRYSTASTRDGGLPAVGGLDRDDGHAHAGGGSQAARPPRAGS